MTTLSTLATSYFASVDAKDLDGILSHFMPDATITIQTDHVSITGHAAIRDMFASFLANSTSLSHEVTSLVVDETGGKVATEQNYIGLLNDGTECDMHNCNFFEIGEGGKFSRVVIWMAGRNPLK